MNKLLLLAATPFLLLCSGTSSGQSIEIPDWDHSVSFELMASQAPVRPGDAFELALVATIVKGYHLYGPEENPPSRTEVSIESATLEIGDVHYPPVIQRDLSGLGEFDLYEGEIAIRVPATATKMAEGHHKVEFTINYQVCTDYACSAPTSDRLALELVAAAGGASVKQLHADVFKKLK